MRKKTSCYILLVLLVFPLISSLITTEHPSSDATSIESFVPANTIDFKRGPIVGMVTNNSAVIFWRTSGLTNARVDYGLDVSLLESESNSTLDTDHYITLSDLEIGSTYWYEATSNGTSSEVFHFKTAPADGTEFKVVIAGDNRPPGDVAPNQPETFSEFADMIIAEEPHLVILTGDFVYQITSDHNENLEAWEAFTNISDRIGHFAPIYGAIGNHDTGDRTGSHLLEYYFDAFVHFDEPSTYFSFDYAGVHFTILDAAEAGLRYRITGAQYDWLVDDLMNTNSAMKLVIGHAPLYPINHIGNSIDINETERDRLQELFEDTEVALYACGHDHAYNRMTVNGVTHLITGGIGAPLYETPWGGAFNHYTSLSVSSQHVNISVIDLENDLRDFYAIPNDDPIEIFLRVVANTSLRAKGTMPEIYFSKAPIEKYYSWDEGTNSTILTGLPDDSGEHTLDVYALDDDDVWSHARFVFRTTDSDPFTPTTPTPTDPPSTIDPLVIVTLIGGVAVVIVIAIVVIKKR
ncbi:MAG: metallophosphoesterase [Candidatus Thorarchaeota archaeon]